MVYREKYILYICLNLCLLVCQLVLDTDPDKQHTENAVLSVPPLSETLEAKRTLFVDLFVCL